MVDDGIEFELHKLGLVVATATEREARKALESLQGMRAHGFALPEELIVGDDAACAGAGAVGSRAGRIPYRGALACAGRRR